MRLIDIKSFISVFPVRNMAASLTWYAKWLGEPDVLPMEGVAEYEVSSNTWLQLSFEDEEGLEKGSIILGVEDIHKCQQDLENAGIETGPVADYEVVLVFDIYDPDGNRISLVQEVEES